MKKKNNIILTIGIVLTLVIINIVGFVVAGERFLIALLIFGAIFLPVIFIARLIIGIFMSLRKHKEKIDEL